MLVLGGGAMSYTSDLASPRARKEHQCSLCAQPIPRGAVYDRWSGWSDDADRWWSAKAHQSCRLIATLSAIRDDIEDGYGQWLCDYPLREMIIEGGGDVIREAIAALRQDAHRAEAEAVLIPLLDAAEERAEDVRAGRHRPFIDPPEAPCL